VRDFTFNQYITLLKSLSKHGFKIQTYREFLKSSENKVAILRHDVDRYPVNALKMAELEHGMNIRATYYFRSIFSVFKPEIIKKINDLGHEIGYHYEDVSLAAKRYKGRAQWQKAGKGHRMQDAGLREEEIVKIAIESFTENLEKLRKIVPVNTICMHGSPMSQWDSRLLWKYYDYKDFRIIGEPYCDTNFNEVFYITDTGRKWNNTSISIRDKVNSDFNISIKSTENIIALIERDLLPPKVMINIHPHRWFDFGFYWYKELLLQSLKNLVKAVIIMTKK
jgi:hypothetical protein